MPGPVRWREHWPLLAAALIYPAWVAYGSLFPLVGWRDDGLSPLVFLGAALPRYWTAFDLLANVVLYLPLGFLWSRISALRWPPAVAILLPALLGAAFSFAIEVLQHWLPSRVPSNIDLLCNALGALGGAIAADRYRASGWAARTAAWRRAPDTERSSAAGLLLLVIWAFVQLSPEYLLFTSGLARSGATPWWPVLDPGRRIEIEAVAVAAHTFAVALLAMRLTPGRRTEACGRIVVGALLVVLAKAVVASLALGFPKAFDWWSAGTLWGVCAGSGLVLIALTLPGRIRIALAFAGLLVGSLALLALPPSPYASGLGVDLALSPARNLIAALVWLGVFWPALALAFAVWQWVELGRPGLRMPWRPPADTRGEES